MPAISLYGRRWHFSSDIVAVPALLSAFFHTAWIIILLVYAGATDSWPRACATPDGEAYVAVLGGLLFCFALNLAIDLVLTLHSLRGAPFEASKRRWVAPLLYASTLPLVAALGFTVYGSYVTTHLEPDCWPLEQRNAVTNLAQGLVFSSWGFMAVASLGIAITYNMYPQHHDLSSWEARCECLASTLCCHANVMRRPDGKRPPLTNIAELTAGLLSHCDLDATDMTVALFLAAAAQNRRRRLRIAKALLPVYRALQEGAASPGGSAAVAAAAEAGGLPANGRRAGLNGRGRGAEGWEGEEEGDEDNDDAASTASVSTELSLNDVPVDRELDRELGELAAQQQAPQAAEGVHSTEPAPVGHAPPSDGIARPASGQQLQPPPPQQQQPAAAAERRQRGRGKSVSWVQEQLGPATPAAAAGLGPDAGSGGVGPDRPAGRLQPPAHVKQQQQQQQAAALAEQTVGDALPMVSPFGSPGAAPAGLLEREDAATTAAEADAVLSAAAGAGGAAEAAGAAPVPPPLGGGPDETAARLPLTEETVALLDQQLGSPPGGSPTRGDKLQATAEQLAGELLQELPRELPDGQTGIVDQLAEAIEEEIAQLGGGQLPEDALLQAAKEDSLDLSALEINPDVPSIWFSAAGSSHPRAPSSAGQLSEAAGLQAAAAEAAGGAYAVLAAAGMAAPAAEAAGRPEEGLAEQGTGQGLDAGAGPAAAGQGLDGLAAASPCAAATRAAGGVGGGGLGQVAAEQGGQAAEEESQHSSESSTIPGLQHAAAVEAAAAAALSAADSAAGAASASVTADGSEHVAPPASEPVPPADEAAAAAVAEVAAAAAATGVARPASDAPSGSVAATPSAKISLQKQLTVRYPVVITPSEHADAFRGPLPAAALADIYAGRHDKVPSTVLREAVHFLKFSYAVYSLEPRVEAPASALDICACLASPPDPQTVVFKGLSELEALENDASIELLHLNCSNRVLAHLPYMICLDHGKRAVVLAIRGTISAADIVTDAIVYPEPLDSFLPPDIRQELSEPAFAHAGMLAAARAIFQDMTERGILQQLVEDEAVGDYTAPQGQQARRNSGAGGSGEAQGGAGGSGGNGGGAPAAPSPPARQYDADAGSSGPGASWYMMGRGGPGGQAAGAQERGARQPADGGRGGGSGGEAAPALNRQSSRRTDATGRLLEGTAGSAAEPDDTAAGEQARSATQQPPALQRGGQQAPRRTASQQEAPRLASVTGVAGRRAGPGTAVAAVGGSSGQAPGRRVGEIMRQKIQEEGWQLIVEGHSLGAGAAALVSLKLRQHFPGLKCIAYSCPGGLVSKNLAHAMASFTTTVAVGKDAVCRATVGNLVRLMDEMVTALARCRQPKLAVLLWPWWRRRRADFRRLFYDYDEIPEEPLEVLHRYYESRVRIGQPLSMYPPGRLIFLRPIKTRLAKAWDAVWIRPEDIIAEGLLISRHALRDHLLSTVYEALTAAASHMEDMEGGVPGALSGEAEARPAPTPLTPRLRARVPAPPLLRRAAQRRWRARLQAQRSGSLQAVLIEAT